MEIVENKNLQLKLPENQKSGTQGKEIKGGTINVDNMLCLPFAGTWI